MPDASRRVVAEALGTCLLVATVVGSGIMADRLTGDGALALLGNTLATGAMLVVLITVFGPISGAHFNPVVSLLMARRGGMAGMLPHYVTAQIAGGVAGTLLTHAMFGLPLFELSTTQRSGFGQALAEAVATFGLIATILAGMKARPDAVAWLVGLYITAAYWFTASTSFANPAVTVARALTDTFAGIAPASVPVFVLAQLTGGALAALVMGWLLAPDAAAKP